MLKGKIKDTDTRTTWAEYSNGFQVEFRYLTPQQLRSLREQAAVRRWDHKTHRAAEEFDQEKFYTLFAEAAIVNWRGLTGETLAAMIVMDEYPDGEVPFTVEDAAQLMLHCQGFDQFVTFMATELSAHDAARKAALAKNSQPSPAAPSGSAAAAEDAN